MKPATISLAQIGSSFEAFYRHEYSQVLALAYVLTGNRATAEDLVQDAFTSAYRRWDAVSAYARPDCWVRRAVANRAVSAIRHRYVETRGLLRMAASRQATLDGLPEPTEEFWAKVRSLPRRQKQTLALHYLEDRSTKDIGEILGCSEATVRVHMNRGRQTLAARLNGEVEL
jgi:RNA polymerase sigma-70 factor (ECF subfamily)